MQVYVVISHVFEKEMGVFVELKDAQAYMKQIGITFSHVVARELVFGRVNSEMPDADFFRQLDGGLLPDIDR